MAVAILAAACNRSGQQETVAGPIGIVKDGRINPARPSTGIRLRYDTRSCAWFARGTFPGTAAERAGILADDRILQIARVSVEGPYEGACDEPAAQKRMDLVRAELERLGYGVAVHVRYRRGDEEKDVELRLSKIDPM